MNMLYHISIKSNLIALNMSDDYSKGKKKIDIESYYTVNVI